MKKCWLMDDNWWLSGDGLKLETHWGHLVDRWGTAGTICLLFHLILFHLHFTILILYSDLDLIKFSESMQLRQMLRLFNINVLAWHLLQCSTSTAKKFYVFLFIYRWGSARRSTLLWMLHKNVREHFSRCQTSFQEILSPWCRYVCWVTCWSNCLMQVNTGNTTSKRLSKHWSF